MSRSKKKHKPLVTPSSVTPAKARKSAEDFVRDVAALQRLPVTYQAINDLLSAYGAVSLFALRLEAIKRIEAVTGFPLICYVTKTHQIGPAIPTGLAGIDDSDLMGFSDLIASIPSEAVDVLLVSNGGSAEATQRIVHLLRNRFKSVRFIIPGNAYSAATLLCFSGDAILMGAESTLGPIDPQINGIPVRAILRGFEAVEKRLAEEGPKALTAYMPLISKYDLHLFEICRSAEALSSELATTWLSQYMLKTEPTDKRVADLVAFFESYDLHKTHARPIDRNKAQELGLEVVPLEKIEGLNEFVRSLYNQYELFFDKSPFYKLFEDSRGVNWGRRISEVMVEVPQSGPPAPSNL